MSVQAGLWAFENVEFDRRRLESVASHAEQYGPDWKSKRYFRSVGMIYQAFDTIHNWPREVQPHESTSGTTVMWDGRLDNGDDLCNLLERQGVQISARDGDAAIIHALYDNLGVESFPKILGDWAMSVWDERAKRLILATDFCGLRRLYYAKSSEDLLWCTDLRSLVSGAGHSFELCDAYIIEYLEGLPLPERTPYRGVVAVPAGHWVEIKEGTLSTHRYWSWDVSRPILYNNDLDYEEHLRTVLRQSVRRRLRSDYPVVAELSGGLDSSSIVCIADELMAQDKARTPAVHTLSYYHDQEPSCDERPYFSIIEQQRGQTGTHINSAKYDTLDLQLPCFFATPFYPHGLIRASQDLWDVMDRHGARTILSGVGGDEFLGGVPTAVPELADLLRQRSPKQFLSSLDRWSRASRNSRWQLLWWSVEGCFTHQTSGWRRALDDKTSLLTDTLCKDVRSVFSSHGPPWVDRRSLPSKVLFAGVWFGVVCQLASTLPPMHGCYERTYPYLDRDVLNFLVNIPRSQIIRAGERRSLMRRALRSLVPETVLLRKNKAVSIRRNMTTLSVYSSRRATDVTSCQSTAVFNRYVDNRKFEEALGKAVAGLTRHCFPVQRAIGLDIWLSSGVDAGVTCIDRLSNT
jgi:asparagine synthase (glutamine-hydrolysing)